MGGQRMACVAAADLSVRDRLPREVVTHNRYTAAAAMNLLHRGTKLRLIQSNSYGCGIVVNRYTKPSRSA
jgi:hypothetical protein